MGEFQVPGRLPGQPEKTLNVPEGMRPLDEARLLEDILRKEAIVDPQRRLELEERQEFVRTQSIEEQLGAPISRTATGARAEFDEPMARFDIARSNLLSEKVAKIQDKFPDIEVRQFLDPAEGLMIPGEPFEGERKIALRLPGEANFILLDSNEVATVSDLMDALGSVVNLESLAAIVASFVSAGQGLIARTIAQVGGGTVGRALDIGVEEARGFEEDPLQTIVMDAASSGLLAGVGELAFAGPRRMVRGITPGEDPVAAQATREFTEATGQPPSPALTSPVARRMENQAVATSRIAEMRRIEDLESLRTDFVTRVDKTNFSVLSDDDLARDLNTVTTDAVALLNLQRRVSPEAAGNALRRGRKTFRKVAQEEITRRYDLALERGADASFDVRVAKKRAQDILEGIRAAGAEPGTTVDVRRLNSELRTELDKLTKVADTFSAAENGPGNPFEAIKELRTNFFDLKNATVDGKATNSNRLAGQIWEILSNTMDNPVGGSAEFRAAFRNASSANRLFERVLDITDLTTIARSNINRPGDLINTLVRPGNAKTLRILKRIIPEREFSRFKDGMATKLLSEPEKIGGFLDSFRADPDALAAVFDAREIELFRTVGEQIRRLNSGPVVKALQNQTTLAQRAKDISTSSDVAAVAEFILRGGGKDSNRGRAMRGGMIQALIDESTELKKGREVLNPQKAIAFVKKHTENGALDAVFTPSEVKFLRDRASMLSFFDFTSDTGASLRAAELASGAAEVVSPAVVIDPRGAFKRFVSGTTGLARNAFIGRIFMSPKGRRLFAGIRGRQPDLTVLRAMAVIAAESIKDIREENE